MNARQLNNFIDDLVAGRRPRSFQANAEDAEVVHAAIALRAERPGDVVPEKSFISSLHNRLSDLSDQTQSTIDPTTRWRRGRTALFGVAAALAVVGGAIGVADVSTQRAGQQASMQVPQGQALRTATFESATGQVMGQIVVYHGHPSWVFMNVEAAHASGYMRCELHLANGVVVAAGSVQLHRGKGEIANTIQVDPRQLRQATLTGPSGAVLAMASFA
jgi:hypothetical protein